MSQAGGDRDGEREREIEREREREREKERCIAGPERSPTARVGCLMSVCGCVVGGDLERAVMTDYEAER